MKTHWTKQIAFVLIATLLVFVAAWSLAAQPITYTYDGRQYAVGVATNMPDQTAQAYRVIPGTDYKNYRMGDRNTAYTYTGVDVAPQKTQVVQHVAVPQTTYVQKTEPVVQGKIQSNEPVVLEAGQTYGYDANEYQPIFSSVQVEARPVIDTAPQVQDLSLSSVQVQGQDLVDNQDEHYEDTQELNYEQDVNHYHEINRYYTHKYLHNLKQVHNNYYTDENVEQVYHDPIYETDMQEPIINEPQRDESVDYEVIGQRTYTVPVTTVQYRPVVSTIATPGMPQVTPLSYPSYGYGNYGNRYSDSGGYGAVYPSPAYPSAWYGNWRYASNWN